MSSFGESLATNSTTESLGRKPMRSNNVLLVFIVIAVITLFLNGRVILFVLLKYKEMKRHRSVWLLTAHLAMISICVPFFYLFNTGEKVYLINVGGPACKILGYGKSVFLGAFAFNINIIVLDRVGSFQERQYKCLTWQAFLAMWIVPSILGIPTAMMSKEKSDPLENFLGYCETVKFLGSQTATIVYELMRMLLLHVAVAINMIRVIFKIRSKLNFIQPNTSERFQTKLRSIRLIYYHFISFIALWLPSGVLIFANRVIARTTDGSGNNAMEKYTTIYTYFSMISFGHFIVTPSISLQLMERKFLCCCGECRSPDPAVPTVERQEVEATVAHGAHTGADRLSTNNHPRVIPGETSRISTFNFTTTAVTVHEAEHRALDVPLEEATKESGESSKETQDVLPDNVDDETDDYKESEEKINENDQEMIWV